MLWRPANEAEACGTLAAFVEWLRALRGQADAEPRAVRAALAAGDPAMLEAVAGFCGLDPAGPCDAWLRRHGGPRVAVTRGGPHLCRRSWTFEAIARSDAAWREACGVAFAPATLLPAIAHCLLLQEVRPDDTVGWGGDPADPRAWAPLAAGAAVVLD